MCAGNGDISRLQSLNGFGHIIAEASIPGMAVAVLFSVYNSARQARVCDSESMICAALRLVCYS